VAFGGTHDETPANLDEGDLSEPEEGSQPIVSSAKVTPLPIPPPSLHTSGHTAHIIFLDPSSINQALGLCSLSSSKKRLTWPPSTPNEPKGLARLIAQYDALRPSLSIARDHADTYIASYEQQIEAAKAAAAQRSKYKKGEAIVDEDGFTLVTRGGTYGATLGGGVSVVSRRFQLDANSGTAIDAEQKKRKKKEKPDFYTFQVRERKRKGQ
jgi:ribosomal RNA-processing protein 7